MTNAASDGERESSKPLREAQVVRGTRPGNRYVRIVQADDLPPAPRPEYVVAPPTVPESVLGRAVHAVERVLFGPPLATAQEVHERLTKVKALAVLSSDALSSVAYATEEMMRILVLAGVAALAWTLPLTLAVLVVLVTVVISYQQTIQAYPHGGGSYTVASDNLGQLPGLVAAAALLTDYVLTVAVSIAAGVLAITSAFPALDPYRVWLALAAIALMAIGNLRGIREAGTIFAAPTYVFLGSMLGLLGYGLWRYLTGTLPHFTPPPDWLTRYHGVQTVSLFLLLRAFSSGAVALTGTEAISNGVPAFKPPESHNARLTLLWMGSLLGLMFLGTSFLARHMGVMPDPTETESVLSIVTRLLFGRGWYFYLVQFSTMIILVLAANTSFADFPRLSSILARDRFVPHQFAHRGDRLAFNTGIVALATVAGALVVVFRGSVSALIPLYAVGVFTAFTLSQAGMVIHWRRLRGPGWWWRAAINGVGATMTAVVTGIIAVTKFLAGAWIVLILVPLMIWQMRKIHRHYQRVALQLRLSPEDVRRSTSIARQPGPFPVIVPIDSFNKASLQAVDFARQLSHDVTVVHVAESPAEAEALERQWREFELRLPLTIIESPYRELVAPLVRYIEQQRREKGAPTLTVVLPEFVPAHLYEVPLHNQTAWRLRTALWTHPGIVVASVPYHLQA